MSTHVHAFGGTKTCMGACHDGFGLRVGNGGGILKWEKMGGKGGLGGET